MHTMILRAWAHSHPDWTIALAQDVSFWVTHSGFPERQGQDKLISAPSKSSMKFKCCWGLCPNPRSGQCSEVLQLYFGVLETNFHVIIYKQGILYYIASLQLADRKPKHTKNALISFGCRAPGFSCTPSVSVQWDLKYVFCLLKVMFK